MAQSTSLVTPRVAAVVIDRHWTTTPTVSPPRLRQTWYSSLNEAEAYFRQFLTSSSSEWKRVSTLADNSASKKGKPRVAAVPEVADVIVHRNSTKGSEDVYRLVLEVPTQDEQVNLDPWKAILTTPELRQEWDPAVEDAHILELFDRSTRISKINFSLGWPANPRDAVTIARSFSDPGTVVDISTSLPRSPDEPAYLRPSPPFVRSHVQLFAWCIQHHQAQQKIRITCFWQHDLKAMWGFGSSTSTLAQQLSTMVLSLFKTVMKRGGRVPKLVGYGNGVSIERVRFQADREALTIDYAIIPDEEGHMSPTEQEVEAVREQRRLTRSIECVLPSLEGWEVQITLKASSEEVEKLPWSAHAIKTNSNPSAIALPDQILLRLTHSSLLDDHSVLKVKVVIEASGGTRGLRLNGLPKKIYDTEQRDPSSYAIPQHILQDIASAADLSIQTASSMGTVGSSISTASSSAPALTRSNTERTPVADKSILSRVRRNYIYFSSLLQEPEAKWRRTTEGRGVSITQLDSIDPTLVVYRAEATFVGVGLWDLYGTVVSPGARVYWDKQHEDAVLLEDVNELSELWYYKSRPAWPVHGRDLVVLKTVYKSPNVIHVFSFSADDPHLFGNIPPVDPNTIRTQVDLQGWSIEALSPTTTSLTLLEQSDPKGWTNKTSIPTQMINQLAGIGEFAIKCGGPPIVTRLTGAKANETRYDHEKGSFKIEYEASASRRQASSSPTSDGTLLDSNSPSIECEIRCDVDTWASSLDIVVDPPPQTMSCLRRHRLSSDGGGLWLTLTHDCVFVDDERLLVLIRRAPGKEKGLVMVNGAKIHVDVEEIPEHELKALSKQKRVKPPRVPLDQPPVMGVIRKRKEEWSDEKAREEGEVAAAGSGSVSTWASAPKISSPLSRFISYAVDQATTTTQQYVAAMTPANNGGSPSPSATKLPIQYALDALAWTQDFHKSSSFSSSSTTDGWTLISEKGVPVHRKLIPEASPIIPVHKGSKVIEGVSAEELSCVISEENCRKIWDDRFDSSRTLESYGNSCRTQFLTSRGGFPFRDRGFYLACVVARTQPPSSHAASSALSRRSIGDTGDQSKNAVFVVSASFSPESITPLFSAGKYNSYNLPIGRMYLDAWVLETLDPYATENYAIPSTRCTRLVAVDYAGAIPAAVNSMINAALPLSILAVETCFKSLSSLPMTRLPAPCLVLAEKKGENRLATVSWKLKKGDENRLLVDESFGVESKVFRTSVLVSMPAPASNGVDADEHASGSNDAAASSADARGSLSAPNTAGFEAPLTPRIPRSRTKNSASISRERREGSQATITAPPLSASSSTSSSSSVSTFKDLVPSTSTETLRSVRSHDTPLNVMPGTIGIGSAGFNTPRSYYRQRSVSTTDGGVSIYAPVFHGQYASSPAGLEGGVGTSNRAGGIGDNCGGSGAVAASPPTRGRTMSSAFTSRGEVKPLKDLVVGEVVVDTRLYPFGYTVSVRTRAVRRRRKKVVGAAVVGLSTVKDESKEICLEVDGKDKGKGRESTGKDTFLKLGALRKDISTTTIDTTTNVSSIVKSSSSTSSSSGNASTPQNSQGATTVTPGDEDFDYLPMSYAIHNMPSSPLHSSSLNAEGGTTRHLLRMTLPTAQYWVSSVRDPLTGEVRKGPKKPLWMEILDGSAKVWKAEDGEQETADVVGDGDEEEPTEVPARLRGFVVDVEIRPVVVVADEKKDDKDKKKKSMKKIKVNGVSVQVVGEKESLTSLGREELLDDRIAAMGVLSRVPNETEALPEDLLLPVAVADDVVDPAVWSESGAGAGNANSASTINNGAGSSSGGTHSSPDNLDGAGGDKKPTDSSSTEGKGENTPGVPNTLPSSITSGSSGNASGSQNTSGGIWGFWSTYRFGFGSTAGAGGATETGSADQVTAPQEKETGEDGESDNKGGATTQIEAQAQAADSGTKDEQGEQQGQQQVEQRVGTGQGQYPLSTVVAVALIAFLIGSLLRSLLSPADFIYVVEGEEANKVRLGGENGWREIKRLFELKYVLGGWDFQVAAVRRHGI